MIEQNREREIIVRRFGLYDRRETLEQIGELLGITRERVRQLEKTIVNRLKSLTEAGKIPAVNQLEKQIIRQLIDMGRVAKVNDLTDQLLGRKSDQKQRSQVAFISELAENLVVISENDNYYQSVGILEYGDEEIIRSRINDIVATIRKHGQPLTIEALHEILSLDHPSFIKALASSSKLLANLKGNWGLMKWPAVNPKNIRDKIFVILTEFGSPMHFSEIAKKIKDSAFKRRDVTTQAIHNELIKDPRFVLIGRGIYALETWGFNQGTVADIIVDILKQQSWAVGSNDAQNKIIEQAFNTRLNDKLLDLGHLVSRKKQFVPTLEAFYAQ